jgi:predicted metal-dependent peptidase
MTAQARYTETKAALLLTQPFFAALLLDMMTVKVGKFPEIFGGRTPTMATNGITIWIDEDFIAGMTVKEALFVLCHEIGHAMWRHMERGKYYLDIGFEGKPFNPAGWNAAGDYVINDMLVKSGIGKMPKMGLLDSKYTYEMVVDDVYRDLMKQSECKSCNGTGKQGGGDGGSSGQGGGDSDDQSDGDAAGSGEAGTDSSCPDCGGSGVHGGVGDTLDTHILEDASGDQPKPSEAQWRRAIQSAKDAAKAMGQMPAHLERFVDSLLEAKVPWEDKLRKAMTKTTGRDTTNWNRPHRRRYITQGLIMPTYSGFGAGTIVFAVDTSGSMSNDELRQALGECDKILTDCNPERVILIGCDARVETVIELQDGDTLQSNIPRIGGGGGTSFIPPFEYCRDEGIKPDTFVYFTDTGGAFPTEEPPYPVIWCVSEQWCEPPFGEVIPVEVK